MDVAKHSGLGVASFIVSSVSGILMFLVVGVAGVIEASTPGGMDEESAAAILIGFGIIGLVMLSILALGLGISGLVQKNRKKVFAVLGTVFSAMSIIGMVSLIIFGLSVA